MSAQRHSYSPNQLTSARGFSLVELMVAMAISLLLLAGVIAIFASSRASYETTDKISRIQENGRFSLDQLAHDIRSAGYVGCSRSPNNLSTSLNETILQENFLEGPLRGYQYVSTGTWSPTLDASVTLPADGSDVLVLRVPKRDATPLRLQSDMVSSTANIVVPNVAGAFAAGDTAVVYSCEARAYFRVTEYTGGVIKHETPGNLTTDISFPFLSNAEVVPMDTVIYYVRARDPAVPSVTSLYRRTNLNPAEELVEGVEQMQIEYGRDTTQDGVIDEYATASAVTDWKRIYSVRVALLVRSLDQYGTDTDTKARTLLGQVNAVAVPAANDRRMREVFTITANLRNRTVIN